MLIINTIIVAMEHLVTVTSTMNNSVHKVHKYLAEKEVQNPTSVI